MLCSGKHATEFVGKGVALLVNFIDFAVDWMEGCSGGQQTLLLCSLLAFIILTVLST
jgi:hypothetical protein